jgi:hypothetical protein
MTRKGWSGRRRKTFSASSEGLRSVDIVPETSEIYE